MLWNKKKDKLQEAEIISFDSEKLQLEGSVVDMALLVHPEVKRINWYKDSVKSQITEAGLTHRQFADRLMWIANELRESKE